MATSLAQQLAHIRVRSINALDLEAQKKTHSKSLLFDAHHAATQSYETLFQVCYEGWQELCRLDSRFIGFAGSLFSEQSKQEDRTQMTAAQNKDLDIVLEDFMGLVGSRLLLKPALKAVEWLVRRFRPAAFKFLQPYIQPPTNPPRHTIVYTVAHNQDLFNNFTIYTLKVCRCGQQYPALLSFWASVTSQAVSLMLDQSRLGRLELQKQNQEDVLRRIMPFLAQGLAMRQCQDLRIGCYMILTIVISKCNPREELLAAMMDMVVYRWHGVTHAGLICLVILCQQKQKLKLPKKAFKALIAVENLVDDLVQLSNQHNTEKLVLSLVLGLLKGLGRAGDADRLRFIRVLLEADLMQSSLVAAALTPMLRLSQGTKPLRQPEDDFDTRSALADLILCLADSETVGPIVRLALEDLDNETRQSCSDLLRNTGVYKDGSKPLDADFEMRDVEDPPVTAQFETLASRIPTQTAFEMSLLTHTDSYILGSLLDAFEAACRSQKHLNAFSELSVLRKPLAMVEPLYISFFIRVWCGHHPPSVRVSAITALSDSFGSEKLISDVQVLLPYILYALADPSPLIRRGAATLVHMLATSYRDADSQRGDYSKFPILGKGQIYGQGRESEEIAWLPWQAVVSFIQDWLVPQLEEFRLDADQVGRSLVDSLSASAERREAEIGPQKFKKSFRASILTWLCSHIVNTPLYAVKKRLLPMLTHIPQVGQVATVTLLTPMLAGTINQGQEHLERSCKKEHIEASQYIDLVMAIATPNDKESIKLLQACINSPQTTAEPLLHIAAFRRLGNVWSLLRPPMQVALGKNMLELAMSNKDSQEAISKHREARDTLLSVRLSAGTLQGFLQDSPNFPDSRRTGTAKRRRTVSPSRISGDDTRRLCFILELVESSATEAGSPLLGRLFKVMTDLQGYKYHCGIDLHYLELLAMNSIRGILERSADMQIERNDLRVDVLVDCIRNSSAPHVQQTALLLVSILASMAPELILHDVMPIFTFMGSSVMKRTDDYSAHVVKQTMDSVIPRIMDSLRRRHRDSMAGVSELLLSFAAAFEHIPRARRLTLFRSLVEMIGANEFFFALLILLHNKFPHNKAALQFSVDLLDCYEVETQLHTVERYLDTIADCLQSKPTFSAHLVANDPSRNSEDLVTDLLSHLVSLLKDKRFVTGISKSFALDRSRSERLRPALSRITYQALSLFRRFPQRPDGGLPMGDFVTTLEDLLDNADDETCFDALSIFELRLRGDKNTPAPSHKACVDFLPRLSSTLEESEHAPSRRTALSCIDHIVERFGKKNIDTVIQATNVVAGDKCFGAGTEELRVTSLLCLSTVVEVLQDEFIPFVPRTLSETLDNLSNKIEEGDCGKRLHNAAYAFFSALLLYTPWAVTGPDLDLLLRVSHGSANANLDEECSVERRATLELVAKQIQPKECFATLHKTWANAMAEGPGALKEQLSVLEKLVGRLSKSAIGRQSDAIARLLIKAFDLRRIQFAPRTEDSYEDKEVEEVENASNAAALALVTRINDTIFRPIFVQLVEWAASSSAKARVHRQITVYKFFAKFFDRFKSITTNYAALIIDDATAILKRPTPTDHASKLLWEKVIQTLQECFKYDQDGTLLIQTSNRRSASYADAVSGFWQSPTHFGPVSEVLLDQLKDASEIPSIDEVTASLTELAVAADLAAYHKTLNIAVLGYMRSDSPAVRLAAVHCQQSLTARLGEEWLALLPEMLPFISELQEDDDEKVERETLKWIKKIEDVLGESLTPMLQ
ncbi:MAG: hypothetical protein Q9188_006146 [Gyalolechia gomerana]